MKERTFSVGLIIYILVVMLGCKDVIQQPLVDNYKSDGLDRAESIVGDWIATGELGPLELDITLDARSSMYKFKVAEGGEVYYGEAAGAFYRDKLVISLNLQTLHIQKGGSSENIFNFSKPSYALLGGYFVDGSLLITPADMEVFREEASEYVSVSGELSSSCNTSNKKPKPFTEFCSLLTSNVYVLKVSETKRFKEAILVGFNKIFPLEDVVVFNMLTKEVK